MRISDWSSVVCSSDLVLGHAVEIRRVGDIGRLRIPRIGFRLGDLDALPARVALEYVGVAGLEQIRGHGLGNDFLDLGVRWPAILEEHILRSEVRRGGEELVRTGRFRWSPEQ